MNPEPGRRPSLVALTRPAWLALHVLPALVLLPLSGCSHHVLPTDRYRDPASLPIPLDVTVAQSPGAILVSWSGEDRVFEIIDGWNIYRRSALDEAAVRLNRAPVTDVNYEDRGVVEGGSYLYTVRGVSPAGVEGLPSQEIEFRYDAVPPIAPTGLKAEPLMNAVRLRWTPPDAPDLDFYRVYRDGVRFASSVPAPEFLDTPVSPDQGHLYEVGAVDRRGNESERSGSVTARSLVSTDRTPPSPPSGLTATRAEGGARLVWNPVLDADLSGYILYRKEEGAVAFERLSAATRITATEFLDTQVQHRVTYTWRVTAVDSAGNESGPGPDATLLYVARAVDTGGNEAGSVFPWCGACWTTGRMQFLVPAAEIGRPGVIESMAMWLRGGAAVYRNVTVRLAHSTSVALNGDFAANRAQADAMVDVYGPATWDTALHRAGDVVSFPFTTPFDYDGARNLLVEISWSGGDDRTAIFGFAARPGGARRLWRQPDPSGSPSLEARQQFLRIVFRD